MNCPICNQELSYMPSRHASKHGLSISDMKSMYPELKYSPTQGTKFSEETRDKMRVKSEKYYESLKLQNRKGPNNSFFGKSHSEESKSRMGRDVSGEKNPFFGKSHTLDSRSSMSSTRAIGISNGTIQTRYHNSGKFKSIKTNKEERYDSKLELFRMIQLDSDSNIEHWTKLHNIKVSYNDNGIIRNYVPDFLITYKNGDIYIEEVKGWDVKTDLKKSALIEYCKENKINYRWLFQDDPIFSDYPNWLKTYKK